jgi:hypothetical protein
LDDVLLTLPEVATHLKLPVSTVRTFIYQDQLTAFYVGGRRLRVTERHLHAFLRACGIQPDDILLTLAEVGERLNMPAHKVYQLTWRQLNPLIAVQLGGRRHRVTERHLKMFQQRIAEELRPDDTVLPVVMVAERLNLHTERVRELIHSGQLIAFYVGGKRLHVTQRHLNEFVRTPVKPAWTRTYQRAHDEEEAK